MNILVINGSPKGERSNTYQLTKAFLAGMGESGEAMEIQELTVKRLDIRACLGCFSCWSKTPGQCCIKDDMGQVIERMLWADVTVWSFPLYYFWVPGPLKNLIDRQLPMVLPFMSEDGGESGSGSHPARYDMSGKKTIVISTCGFYTADGSGQSTLFCRSLWGCLRCGFRNGIPRRWREVKRCMDTRGGIACYRGKVMPRPVFGTTSETAQSRRKRSVSMMIPERLIFSGTKHQNF